MIGVEFRVTGLTTTVADAERRALFAIATVFLMIIGCKR